MQHTIDERSTGASISSLLASALCLTTLLAPAVGQTNDECGSATPIFGAGAFPFDTTMATTGPVPWPCAAGGNDVWFQWFAPADGTYVFDTCAGTTYDSALEVFRGNCAALIGIECNDDACGLQSRVTIPLAVAGLSYYVRVGGFNGATGTGTLTVTLVTPPGAPLVDQQRLVSSPGTGHNNADVSERDHCVMAYQCNSFEQGDRLIEDFVIPDEPSATAWHVNRIRVYAFDCNEDPPPVPPAEPQSTIDRMCIRVWDGVPGSPGATVLFGDTTTNVLSATGWTGIYRAPDANTHPLTSFPIMYADADVGWLLPDGHTYWIEWGLGAPAAICLNQPACPPNPGQTGNGLWVLHDTPPRPLDRRLLGCDNPQGDYSELPFQVYADRVQAIGALDPTCIPNQNSTNQAAALTLVGTGLAGGVLDASVSQGPPGQFGYVLSGPNPGLYIVPPGSAGIICLAAPQYRYSSVPSRQLFQFDAGGSSQAVVGGGPSQLPTDGSYAPVPVVMSGTTRYFQAWYRDIAPFNSNFSDSRGVMFL